MLLVDNALARLPRENYPIGVAVMGAGYMGTAIALQIKKTVGMRLAVHSSRHLRQTPTADMVCKMPHVEVVVEATGDIEFGASTVLNAMKSGKHVVLMNAELDATLGPILKQYADKAGVIYTACDGDQPGVIGNLYRYVKGLNLQPVMCGNIKTFQNRYSNPDTVKEFATKVKQNPRMIASFADGTKISFEQASVANGTGMRVGQRGMYGPVVVNGAPIMRAVDWYPKYNLLEGPGIVDYVVGAHPTAGVFVIGWDKDGSQQEYMSYYKMGPGPLYVFHVPYHLCHLEAPNSIARAVLFKDATLAPQAAMVDVVATAKRDLKIGEFLDGIGGYMAYGQCENTDITRAQKLLPMGLAGGCQLTKDVSKDQVLTYDDVSLPAGRLVDQLREEQNAL